MHWDKGSGSILKIEEDISMFPEHKIKEFGSKICDLIKGKDLTCQETKALFSQVLLNEQPDLQQGAFLATLTAKGETPEEIAGG